MAITESAMRGEIFTSFERRVALLKGLDVSVMQDIAVNLPLMDGLERTMHPEEGGLQDRYPQWGDLRTLGSTFRINLISTTCIPNRLEVVDGKLTGRRLGEVDGRRRQNFTQAIAQGGYTTDCSCGRQGQHDLDDQYGRAGDPFTPKPK